MTGVPTWEWITIILCVLLSGYFSGSETAFVSLSRAKIQALLDSRGKKRDPLKIWLDNPSALLTSILIGNNLVNVTASALATDIASKIFQSQAIAAAVGVMTLVILVFGEITPKVMARRYAEQFVSSVAYTLGLFYYVTWPITRFFTWTTSSLIKITGGDPSQDFSTVEVEELELLVSLSAREGGIDKHPASIINRVFNLSRLTVKDIMIPRTEMIALEQSEDVNHIIRIANSSGHSRLPVYRENLDQMVGVFHVKDLLLVSHEEWRDFKVADHFHPPYYVPESAPLGRTLREFQKRKIHLAVVVDEFGGTEGVVTLEDILEELVGEIQDEFDRDVVMMRKLPSGALEVSGRAPVEDLRKIFPQLESEFPSKTVGGLIMEITGRVPSPGETADALGLRFTIVGADERQIKRVRVEPLTPS
jgi:CBS domain containing-hemolysin-like protein